MIKVKLLELDIRIDHDIGQIMYIHKDAAKIIEHPLYDTIEIDLYSILSKVNITQSAQRLRIRLEKQND